MNSKSALPILLLLALLVLTACELPFPLAAAPTEPPPPSPTARLTSTPQVLPPTFTPLPPTATRPIPTATATRLTLTPSRTAPPASLAFIQILSPGAGSKITSPVTISGEANTTFEQNLVVAVYDSAGKVLALKSTTTKAEMGMRGKFNLELAFVVAREQAGRVAVYDTSPAHGGILHLASAEVTLRPAGGKPEILPVKPGPPLFQLYTPSMNAVLIGGSVSVSGYGGPVFENQFSIKICGAGAAGTADPICGTSGNVIARATGVLTAPDVGKPGYFTVVLPFKVAAKTRAWVVVYDNSERDGQPVFVTSQIVQLMP